MDSYRVCSSRHCSFSEPAATQGTALLLAGNEQQTGHTEKEEKRLIFVRQGRGWDEDRTEHRHTCSRRGLCGRACSDGVTSCSSNQKLGVLFTAAARRPRSSSQWAVPVGWQCQAAGTGGGDAAVGRSSVGWFCTMSAFPRRQEEGFAAPRPWHPSKTSPMSTVHTLSGLPLPPPPPCLLTAMSISNKEITPDPL